MIMLDLDCMPRDINFTSIAKMMIMINDVHDTREYEDPI